MFLICLIVGFISFAQYIHNIRIPENPFVNAIIVLTGENIRIEKAFELLEKNIGSKVFISGVHHSVSKDILLKKIPIRQNLAKCCIDIGYEAINTEGNALEAYEWAKKNNFYRILVVTHDYHMPRTFLELNKINNTIQFIPYPIISHYLQKNNLILNMKMLTVIFVEYVKILLLSAQDELRHNFL
ncbi:YdcF family protein [Candidatus Liberibacter africanus]|uniref:YdcF family protein n=1 Tax=Liberibacter africanus TaxID=34020 RepID=UPI001FD4AD4F|nr:YdcF family protein [Candidatus Liberibacter africanus]